MSATLELAKLLSEGRSKVGAIPRDMKTSTEITNLSEAALDVLLAIKSGEDFVDVGHLSAPERGGAFTDLRRRKSVLPVQAYWDMLGRRISEFLGVEVHSTGAGWKLGRRRP